MKPIISVLICSYNASQFIESTILSVLNQTYRDIELLVLDNASSDDTVHKLNEIQKKDARLKIVASKENLGAYPGLNFLLHKAQGTYIAINDHDDIWHSSKLEKQIKYLESHPESVGCGTSIINWYEEYQKGILRRQPENHFVAWHTSFIYRNQGFRYDISKKVGTDFFFMQNILCKDGASIHNIQEPLVFRRIWKGQKNLSSNWMKNMKIFDILTLQIPMIDKVALLNRKLVPGWFIEWNLINLINRKDTLLLQDIKKNAIMNEYLPLVSSGNSF